jgi:hypothetical protein
MVATFEKRKDPNRGIANIEIWMGTQNRSGVNFIQNCIQVGKVQVKDKGSYLDKRGSGRNLKVPLIWTKP